LLLSLSLLACDVELYHDLSERHVNEALLSLRQAGIAADKKTEW
jgi:type III secretory pathway lipoprotein EscJ